MEERKEVRIQLICFIVVMLIAAEVDNIGIMRQAVLIGLWRYDMILYVGFAHDPLAVTYPREKYEYNPVANLILYASFRKTKKLPREIIQGVLFSSVIFALNSLVSWSMAAEYPGEEKWAGILFIASWEILGKWVYIIKALKVPFYKKYKRLTIKNLRYLLAIKRLDGRVPENYRLGKCIILEREANSRKSYYRVKVKKSGNVYGKVLYCGDEECDEQKTYTLHEVCNVKYML